MATSGVYTWTPTIAGLIDEAAERAGMDPATLTHRHVVSAMTSLNYVYRELETENIDEFYRIDQESTSVSSGTSSVSLASGSVEILKVWYRNSGETTDIPIKRVSRDDYKTIATKASSGPPSLYYVNHESLNAPALVIWPVPNATITLYYDRMRFIEDATTLSQTPDAHRLMYDLLAYGIAFRFAEKYNVERMGMLKSRFDELRFKVKSALMSRGPVMIYGSGRNRRRRA